MKKFILLILLLSITIILSGCWKQSRVSSLEDENQQYQIQIEKYQNQVSRLENIIEKCNENITEAKTPPLTISFDSDSDPLLSKYKAMSLALSNLKDCNEDVLSVPLQNFQPRENTLPSSKSFGK